MRDYFKKDGSEFLQSIDCWKMSWIILIDNSGSMGPHALDPNSLAIAVKKAIGTTLEEIKKISEERKILSNIRIITFNDTISYAIGNRNHGEYIIEAVNKWQNFELIPDGGTNISDAIYEAGESIRSDRFGRYLDDGFWLSPVLILLTDAMNGIMERAGNSVDYVKHILEGNSIRVSLGLRHPYDKNKDTFASIGSIERPDGSVKIEKPFSFFLDSCDGLSNICKLLSQCLISIALDNDDNHILLDPTDDWDEDDAWRWV